MVTKLMATRLHINGNMVRKSYGNMVTKLKVQNLYLKLCNNGTIRLYHQNTFNVFGDKANCNMVTKLMLHCHIMLVWTCISTPSTKLSRLVYLSFDLSCTFPILLCFLQRIPQHTKVTVTWWKLWIRHLKIQIILFSECDHSKTLATKNISFILAGYLAIVLLKCGNVSNSNSVELNVHQSGHSSSVYCWHG